MEYAYAAADIVVSRAGAMSVAELCVAKKPVVFIPFPFAADDHQTKNARAMAEEKAAVLIETAELSGQRLADEIRELISRPDRLKEIEENARRIAIPDAEQRIVNLIESAIEKHV